MERRINVDLLEELRLKNNWDKSDLAREVGISRAHLWRIMLSPEHPDYCPPGKKATDGICRTFPRAKGLIFLS